MTIDDNYLPFSQRTGLSEIPPQLRLGEVSSDLRRLLGYYFSLEIDRASRDGFESSYFPEGYNRVAMDFHVLFLKQNVDTYNNSPYGLNEQIQYGVSNLDIGPLFDLVEFFIRHPGCSDEMRSELAGAFETARAAYRVVGGQIVAIGSEEQAEAFVRAIRDADTQDSAATRRQLIAAALALRNSDWAGSVRESIHAVESTAIRLAPEAKELGPALSVLEKQGHLHGGLKAAFRSLYGYTSDEEGVRHALVFNEEAQVDEADALFMLGACSSFVSYLLSRSA